MFKQPIHLFSMWLAAIAFGILGILFLPISASAQTGATVPNALSASAENLKLVDFHGVGEFDYAVIDGDLLYVSQDVTLLILDIRDPNNPTRISETLLASAIYQFATFDHYLYVLNGTDLTVIDIADPRLPRIVNSIYVTEEKMQNAKIQITGERAYVSIQGSFNVYSLTDPENPTLISNIWSIYADGFQVRNNYIDIWENGCFRYGCRPTLRTYEFTMQNQFVEIASYSPFPSIEGGGSIRALQGQLALVWENQGLSIYDFSGASYPVKIGFCTCPSGPHWNTKIVGDFAFVSRGDGISSNFIDVISLVAPTKPTLVASREISASSLLTIQDSTLVAFGVLNGYGYLTLFDVKDPLNLREMGHYSSSLPPYNFHNSVIHKNLLIQLTISSLTIADNSTPAQPALLSQLNFDHYVQAVAYANKTAFVATNPDCVSDQCNVGLLSIDISNPLSPTRVNRLDIPPPAGSVVLATEGNYLFIGDHANFIWIYDVSQPSHPQHIATLDQGGNDFYELVPTKDYLFVNHISAISVVDIHNPSQPVQIASYSGITSPNYYQKITIIDDFLFAWTNEMKLERLDISEPAKISKVDEYSLPSTSEYMDSVSAAGNLILVASHVIRPYKITLRIFNTSFTPVAYAEVATGYMTWHKVDESLYGYGSYIIHLELGHTIQGRIQTESKQPVSGVELTTNTGISTITDAQGVFTFTGVLTESLIITPLTASGVFSPSVQTTTVPSLLEELSFTLITSATHTQAQPEVAKNTSGIQQAQSDTVLYLPLLSNPLKVATSQQIKWQSLGGILNSKPALWSNGDELHVVVQGTNHSLWERTLIGGQWSTFRRRAEDNRALSEPSIADRGDEGFALFTQDADGSPRIRWFQQGWSDWGNLNLAYTGMLAIESSQQNLLIVFARSDDGEILLKARSYGVWSTWQSLAPSGFASSSPAVVRQLDGSLHLFVVGKDQALWQRIYTGTWSEWQSLGGQIIGDPVAVQSSPDVTDVFVRSPNLELMHLRLAENVAVWTPLSGVLLSIPTVVTEGNGEITVYVRGTDDALYQRQSLNGVWSPQWLRVAPIDSVKSDPVVTIAPNGQAYFFVQGKESELSYAVQ